MLPLHKTLVQYLPPLFQGIGEFQALTATEQQEADGLWAEFDGACEDLAILTATDRGLSRYEKPLGIRPKGDATLDERRIVLLARYNEQLPFTRRVLEQQLESLCGEDGFTLEIHVEEKTADVLVALTAKSNFDEVGKLLERVLPCNMGVTLGLKYNQHQTLAGYTHGALAARTCGGLRNEVLDG